MKLIKNLIAKLRRPTTVGSGAWLGHDRKPQKFGLKIVFGNEEAPKLPKYWMIFRHPDEPAIVVSPEGEQYLIGDGVLYPWRICPTEGLPNSTLKPGEKYIATEAAIKWPNDES